MKQYIVIFTICIIAILFCQGSEGFLFGSGGVIGDYPGAYPGQTAPDQHMIEGQMGKAMDKIDG